MVVSVLPDRRHRQYFDKDECIEDTDTHFVLIPTMQSPGTDIATITQNALKVLTYLNIDSKAAAVIMDTLLI